LNGSAAYPNTFNYPYGTLFGSVPLQAYLNVQIKL